MDFYIGLDRPTATFTLCVTAIAIGVPEYVTLGKRFKLRHYPTAPS